MAVDREIRLAGVPLGRCRHMCAFFNDKDQEFRLLAPFIKEGLEQGDRAFYIVDGRLRGEHLERLRRAGIDVEARLRSGQLELKSWDEAYLREGRFDQEAMLALVEEVLDSGRANGYPVTRVVANMEWALEGMAGSEDLVEYESRADAILCRYDDPVICTYDANKFGGRTVLEVMRAHPVTIVGGVLHQNPFYLPADEFLEELRSREEPHGGNGRKQADAGELLQQELRSLRDCMSGLVALGGLRALWSGRDPRAIAESLADALLGMLQLDLVLVRLECPPLWQDVQALKGAPGALDAERTHSIAQTLAPLLARRGAHESLSIANPLGAGLVSVIATPLGEAGEFGQLLAASARPGFPDESQGALLGIAASQMAAFLKERQLSGRSQAEAALRESEERLRLAVDGAALGTWHWDIASGRLAWSDRCYAIFGMPPGVPVDLEGFRCLVHPEDREGVEAAIRDALGGALFTSEYRIRWPDGSEHWVSARGRTYCDADGRPIRMEGVVREIGDRKRIEEERARRAGQLQTLADAALAIGAADSIKRITEVVTEAARDVIGAGMSVTSFTAGEDWAQAIVASSFSDKYAGYRSYDAKPDGSGIYNLVCQTNRPMRMTQAELEAHPRWRGYGREAGKHPALRGWLAVPLVGRDGKNLGLMQLSDKYAGEFDEDDEAMLVQLAQLASQAVANARLLDEVQTARARLEALSRRLVSLQEDERQAIARELHDEVGQLLTGLGLMLEAGDGAGAGSRRQEMKRVVNELIERVRDLSMNLRPPMLDELGLLPTLLWQIERFEAQTGIRVEFRHARLDVRFPPQVELTAVRIVQEALTNVARHAGVSQVKAAVWADGQSLGAWIEDQGRGFSVETVLASQSSGLAGMRERSQLLGGRLTIESAPGRGTRLHVALPLSGGASSGGAA